LERVSEVCLKDDECRKQATGKYLNYLDARNSREVMGSVEKGVNITKTVAILVLTIMILVAVYIFIRTVLDPTFIQGLMDQLTESIDNMFTGFTPPA
jgi:hypothetical protein